MSAWNKTPASGMGDVAVSPSNATVWLAGKYNGSVWFSAKPDKDYAGKQFTQIPANEIKRISVWKTEDPTTFPDGEIWAIDRGNAVSSCRYNVATQTFLSPWKNASAADMVDIAVASDGTVWMVSREGGVFYSRD